MQVLFIHEAFPAQFGHLALELTRRYGWQCKFLVEDLSRNYDMAFHTRGAAPHTAHLTDEFMDRLLELFEEASRNRWLPDGTP